MIDERARRRPTYRAGTLVRLADGQLWSLPAVSGEENDPVLGALLRAVNLPEPGPEQLRDELALTIALLSRNYQLSPETYPLLLTFRAGDSAKGELQDAIRRVARDAVPSRVNEPAPNVDRAPRPAGRWRLFAAPNSLARVRARWSSRTR
jgi:hypothetical protein